MNRDPCYLSALYGPQGLTEEDREYRGSRYSEVKAAVFENPYQKVWGAAGNDPWPVYISTTRNNFAGCLPGGRPDQLAEASGRTVDSYADLRWGEDKKGYRRNMHPNGVCLFGRWEISEDNPYSGYFRAGSRGLMIARIAPHGTATCRGHTRSIGFVGKIYPTTDENHPDPLFPANFVSQQDLGGDCTDYLNDAEWRNVPNVSLWRRGVQTPILARAALVFRKVDKRSTVRQVHTLAELGKPEGEPTNAPEHLVIKMTPGQPRIEGEALDFRDEVYSYIFDPGDPEPKRTLSFDIAVSDEGTIKGPSAAKRVTVHNPRTIGKMIFDNAVASYNGDHVIHFHHPRWRKDRNDPSSGVRVDGHLRL